MVVWWYGGIVVWCHGGMVAWSVLMCVWRDLGPHLGNARVIIMICGNWEGVSSAAAVAGRRARTGAQLPLGAVYAPWPVSRETSGRKGGGAAQ